MAEREDDRLHFCGREGRQDGLSAEHHWDVAAQTDRVKWKGKDVTVNLAEPGAEEEAKAAYARWVNDSYWLLAPLKLKDKGTNVSAEGTKEMDGAERASLALEFRQGRAHA